MVIFHALREAEQRRRPIRVAVLGTGYMGRGIAAQMLGRMPGLRAALLVNRTVGKAVAAYALAGVDPEAVVVSDDPRVLGQAIAEGRPAATGDFDAAGAVEGVDAVIEATGDVTVGAREALRWIGRRVPYVSMNAETDATVGCLLQHRARQADVVYTTADGDQPGVLMRLVDYVRTIGFEVVAAVSCKGFLDVRATPDSVRPFAERMLQAPAKICSFADGTKMNIEQAVLANATGLVPDVRGMHGIATDLGHALEAFRACGVLDRGGVVEYTLGGDFGGGVFVIGRSDAPALTQQYLEVFKLGTGPDYLFYRPYHLCHFEAPLSAAEAVLFGVPTAAPLDAPVAEVVALAKRALRAGERLDGIGGYTVYGQIDRAEAVWQQGLLPVGLAAGARVRRDVPADRPLALDDVELDEEALPVRLWREQRHLFAPRRSVVAASSR